ncbi:MAG: N-acyl homoserine lactonase family protein [Chloroflexi bacterium]|nr:N-acyl homoserine lactonase family protein [Chloroflexota bacterium]
MHIHAISTGHLQIKRSHRLGQGDTRAQRLANCFLDPHYTEPLPVHAWVIEHPEGVILIDTGETARVLDPEYFPAGERFFWSRFFRFHITPDDEIGPQLKRLGITPDDVRWVICTHLHLDHTDGIAHFPKAEFLVARTEMIAGGDALNTGMAGGWPAWFAPTLIDYVPEPIGPFKTSYPVTAAGDVHLVPTPGHTAGHQSVILEDDDVTYFFAGDTSFDVPSLLEQAVDGIAHSSTTARATQRRICALAESRPLVYLPTHDHDAARRLADRETLLIA